jgi:hypothetical protein
MDFLKEGDFVWGVVKVQVSVSERSFLTDLALYDLRGKYNGNFGMTGGQGVPNLKR